MKSYRRSRTIFALYLFGWLIVVGCSKEDLDKMVADAKNKAGSLKDSASQAIEKTKQSVQSVADTDGTGAIQLEGEIKFGQSFIRLIPADGNRPAIVQIKSSRESSDSFPAYFIQSEVNVGSLDELSGKTVSCNVFAQKSKTDPVWSNQGTNPILVSIQKEGTAFKASFQGVVVNSLTGSQANVSGRFEPVEF
jgi:hypothetical protein